MGTTRFMAWSVCGAVLHVALLILPLGLLGRLSWALTDLPCCLFLALATWFCLGDLFTIRFSSIFELAVESPADQRALQLARASSLSILLIFWTALTQHAASRAEVLPSQILFGTLVMVWGTILRWLAIRTLGKCFVTEVAVRSQQPLVQSGIYRWIRHPSETGQLAFTLGTTVLLSSPLAALLWCVALLPTTLVRLRHEERSLADGFGPRFEAYARRVKGLIPFIV